MVDKVVKRITKSKNDLWQAFKLSVNIKGYEYYKPPPELRYRYPAPGSCPQLEVDNPNLYKPHYKTPYRNSPYNIQKIEKKITDKENMEMSISSFP